MRNHLKVVVDNTRYRDLSFKLSPNLARKMAEEFEVEELMERDRAESMRYNESKRNRRCQEEG